MNSGKQQTTVCTGASRRKKGGTLRRLQLRHPRLSLTPSLLWGTGEGTEWRNFYSQRNLNECCGFCFTYPTNPRLHSRLPRLVHAHHPQHPTATSALSEEKSITLFTGGGTQTDRPIERRRRDDVSLHRFPPQEPDRIFT